MRFPALLPTVFATSAMISSLSAQEPRIVRVAPDMSTIPFGRGFGYSAADEPRAIIGVSTTSSATSRDTLGVLVSTVRSGSPAEKAGIEEGNRIASINGVSLKLAAPDIGDDQMAGVMARRLSRELDRLKSGDEVDLRIYSSGQLKTVKVKTVAPGDLYAVRTRRTDDDRATLGLSIAVTGSSRDTIGVFVMSVEDGSPAAKAGIEEGSRIASINGVDVRSRRSADDDEYVFRTPNVSRLEREMSRLKPGDDVDLRVYYNGQFRNVKTKAGRMSDLPRHGRTVHITTGDNVMFPPISMSIDGAQIGDQVRRAMDEARVATSGALQGMGRALGRMGNRVDW
ncbi:MAG TPA: PDZ domain-containing protein [Gemmatimonadaceae bacterium]|nr:PDZ domain-containing protein [Gemmatimonadaceae bacterium]